MAIVLLFGMCNSAMAQLVGDPVQGETLFGFDCSVCHSVTGQLKIGPYLDGVVDRQAGTI